MLLWIGSSSLGFISKSTFSINLHASALVFTCLHSWNLIFHLRSIKNLLCFQKLFQISICMLLLCRFGSNWLLAAHFSGFPRTEQLPVCSSVLLYLRSNLCTTVLLKEILDTRLGKRQFFTLLLTLWVIRAVKNFTRILTSLSFWLVEMD